LNALNKLYVEVDFDNYFTQYQEQYEMAVKQVEERLPPREFTSVMEKFYNKSFGSYNLIPSLLQYTTMGFGVNYETNEGVNIYNIFGGFYPKKFAEFDMGFNDESSIRELSTHEFGHSFANPVIDSLPEAIVVETEHLFAAIKEPMENQGYGQWKICLYEHLVRAGEVIIARILGNWSSADDLLVEYVGNRNFLYLPIFVEELQNYYSYQEVTYVEAVKNIMSRLEDMGQ